VYFCYLNKILHGCATATSGFTQAGVYARRQFCADLEVYRPQELLWNPRLREAASTLAAMRGKPSSSTDLKKNKVESFA